MYCAYLVKSAPELLPGPVPWTKRVYDSFVSKAREIEDCDMATILENMADGIVRKNWNARDIGLSDILDHRFRSGGALAKLLMRRSDTWEMLALVWVQLLVYAAPYGNAEEHMRRLSQGGELITHLWALLYHLDIREWKILEANNLHNVSTIEDAQRIRNDDDHDLDVVVLFASPDVRTLSSPFFALLDSSVIIILPLLTPSYPNPKHSNIYCFLYFISKFPSHLSSSFQSTCCSV
jgi:hypothetical protein